MLDLEQALDALQESIPADRQIIAKTIFLQGYQSVKMLEPNYAEKLKLMRRFCNLYSYAKEIIILDDFEISTEHLVLKPLGKKYLKSTILYAMDYENTKYMCHLPDETVEEVEDFLTNVENEWKKEQPKFLEFAIIYNDIHIGAVSVYFENDSGELGWIINKNYWRRGFAYEAARALINYVKTEIKISHFLAHCDAENIASYKVMEKLGMNKTGEWGGRRNKSASEDSLEYQYEMYL